MNHHHLPPTGSRILLGRPAANADYVLHRVDYNHRPSRLRYCELPNQHPSWPLVLLWPRLSWMEGYGACIEGTLNQTVGIPPWDTEYLEFGGVAMAALGESVAAVVTPSRLMVMHK